MVHFKLWRSKTWQIPDLTRVYMYSPFPFDKLLFHPSEQIQLVLAVSLSSDGYFSVLNPSGKEMRTVLEKYLHFDVMFCRFFDNPSS